MVQRSSDFHTLIATTFCLPHKRSKMLIQNENYTSTLEPNINYKMQVFLLYTRITAQEIEVGYLHIISLRLEVW